MSAERVLVDCYSCDLDDGVLGQCAESRRPCGHHCNHIVTDDDCHWCETRL